MGVFEEDSPAAVEGVVALGEVVELAMGGVVARSSTTGLWSTSGWSGEVSDLSLAG